MRFNRRRYTPSPMPSTLPDTFSLAAAQPRLGRAPAPGSSGPELAALARLLERSSDCLVQLDARGFISFTNAAARAELQWPEQDAGPRLHWGDLLERQGVRQPGRALLRALRRHGLWEGELLLNLGGRSHVPFHVLASVHAGESEQGARYSALLRNLTAERRDRQQLQRQADILQAITEAIPATVVVVDGEGRYRFANQAFERYCGLTREQIIGRRAIEVLGADEIERRKPFMLRAYKGETVEFVLDYPGEQGTRWLALSCIPLKVDGMVDGFVGISQDVTREHLERDRLVHLAERDPLTGLLNRAGFERSLERLMYGGQADAVALLYIDLDHFKPVNDRHGHLVGDRLLQLFAQRLVESVRATDVVARLGGDEFTILLAGVSDPAQAVRVADKVLAAARAPFVLDGCTLGVTASVGIAFGLQPQAGWRELVARADAMLYRAKAQGRGRAAG